jgi:hypothetical protein
MTVVDGNWAGAEAAKAREAKRVARILRRDKREASDEAERQEAAREVAAGKIAASDRARLGPTPEHAAKVDFEPYQVEEIEAAGARRINTVRRASVNRVKQLYDRGVLTDDTYPACLWYQRQREAASVVLSASASAWGERVAAEVAYGFIPTMPAAVEAWNLWWFARLGLADPSNRADIRMLELFEAVVLGEWTIDQAAKHFECRPTTATLRLRAVAWRLRERISHLLPVRGFGAGAEMAVEAVGEVERPEIPETPQIASDGAEIEDLGQSDGMISVGQMLDVMGALSTVDPAFLNERGLMRPWAEISAIIRGRFLGGVA